MRLRNLVVDGPNSLGGRARARRWDLFTRLFPDVGNYSVLDLGGTPATWLRAPVRPATVTVLNLYDDQFHLTDGRDDLPPWLDMVHGDACAPPEEIGERRFDLVFSNSLIEHVGGPYRRGLLTEVISRVGTRYWVQTPYRYFPIEPHWIFPGFQFLPLSAQAWLSRKWPLMHTKSRTMTEGVDVALGTELISITELRHRLPDAEIHLERFAGLPKSLIAVRT